MHHNLQKKKDINLFVLLLFQCKNSSLAADLCEQEIKKDEDRVETSQKAGREIHILLWKIIVFTSQQDGRKKRTAKRLGVTSDRTVTSLF